MKRMIALFCAAVLLALFAGCNALEASLEPETITAAVEDTTVQTSDASVVQATTKNSAVTTAADSISISNVPGKTITEDGTYTISGTISGQVLVTAKNVRLILDGATITCDDGPGILGYYEGGKQMLTVELRGKNTVTGKVKHGIQGKDELTITGSGSVDIYAEKDGVHGGDLLTIAGGNINVKSSNEGMEAPEIVFTGGKTVIHAKDDGINAASDDNTITPSVSISGGTLIIFCNSDGIDSNGTLAISGGTVAVFINAPRDGDTTDVDRQGTVQQPILYVNSSVKSGTTIAVGEFSVTTEADATAFCLSLPGLSNGQSYQVNANGSLLTSVTATTTTQGMMMGGPGGGRGNGRW